jgi:DNA ligase (NAD+)
MKYQNSDQNKYFELTKTLLQKEITLTDIDELINVLVFHEYKYYVENNPIISDQQYDILYNKLKKIEAENPDAVRIDSPTQRVASDLSDKFSNVAHITPMLSLGNAYDGSDLIDFHKQLTKLLSKEESEDLVYCIEPKYDGGSIALVYEDDYLVRAATRGNGAQGDEITNNARAIPSVPLRAMFSDKDIYKVELRGEAVIAKDVFETKNKKRKSKGLQLFANARNAATGGLRMKDPSEVSDRGLSVFIFQIAYAVDREGNDMLPSLRSHFESLELLSSLGFKVAQEEKLLCKNIQEAIAFGEKWAAKRDSYNYEIDGMVVKLDDFSLQERCGMTQHHPRWAIALKFKAKQAVTTLVDVEYQVGKIGSITPVAKVEPTPLAGVTISSISLHNEEFILQKDLHLGDKVLIERAGDVIPYIVKAMPELRTGTEKKISFPEFCPINEEEKVHLEKSEGESAWRCNNCSCGAQDLQKIIFHVSKSAMDIDGFGKSYVEKFFELGWIRDIADVYNLDYDKISSLEGFGQRSADNLQTAIEQAKTNPLHRILHSLSIHHLGKKASKIIAERIDHIMDLVSWDTEKFTEIKDIGPVVAENVAQFFSVPKNIALIEKMESYGVDMRQKEKDKARVVDADAPLVGKTILFTGTLVRMGRKEAQQLAEQAGARNISAVSSNLNILVAGAKAGSKLKKATALGTVQVMSEDEFLELIGWEG